MFKKVKYFLVLILVFWVFSGKIFHFKYHNFSEITRNFGRPVSEHFFNISYDNEEFTERFLERGGYFFRYWNIQGVSFAVSYNDKIIYAHGYGFADTTNHIAVQPYHLFRVASVSKLITAVAIMKLVEERKLSLDSKVFGVQGILKGTPYDDFRDRRCGNITVRNLLNHSGGWTTRYGDPMFNQSAIAEKIGKPIPLKSEDYIEFALQRNLHFNPGSSSYYSNLGYVILGKVIEAASGTNYETYVKSRLLFPLGIYDARLAKNMASQRAPLEVNYYEQKDAVKLLASDGSGELISKVEGGNNIEALGGAGAWLFSVTDMLKFIAAIDGFPQIPDILKKESILEMISDPDGFGPLGWRKITWNDEWIRTGSFAGTSCVIKRMPNGITFAAFCNTSAWTGPEFPFKMESFFTRELMRSNLWPDN